MQKCKVKNERGGTVTRGSGSASGQQARVSEHQRVGASGVWKERGTLWKLGQTSRRISNTVSLSAEALC